MKGFLIQRSLWTMESDGFGISQFFLPGIDQTGFIYFTKEDTSYLHTAF